MEYEYLLGVIFILLFLSVCIFSVLYAPDVYHWQHYNFFRFKHWLKYGRKKKDFEEEKIKKEVKKMTIDNILKLLKKYNIDFDSDELLKATFNIKMKYYRLILAEKERLKENKRIDELLSQKIKKEKDDFDAAAFQRKADERFKEFMKNRNK